MILAQSTFVPSGISVRGGVATPLPLLPCVVLQSAIKFINLTVPSSAGRMATNLRCLQRMGAPRAEALAGGAIDDVSNTIVQAALFALTLPFVGVNIDTSQFKGAGPIRRLAPRDRHCPRRQRRPRHGRAKGAREGRAGTSRRARRPVERRPHSAQATGGLRRERRGRAALRAALGATCLAYGVHLNVAELIFVNTSAAVLSSVVPVPGGIGAAEAALSAGLIAMGVDESTAFAIAITQRLCTFYLPPIWGYFSLRWLARKGYV